MYNVDKMSSLALWENISHSSYVYFSEIYAWLNSLFLAITRYTYEANLENFLTERRFSDRDYNEMSTKNIVARTLSQ